MFNNFTNESIKTLLISSIFQRVKEHIFIISAPEWELLYEFSKFDFKKLIQSVTHNQKVEMAIWVPEHDCPRFSKKLPYFFILFLFVDFGETYSWVTNCI